MDAASLSLCCCLRLHVSNRFQYSMRTKLRFTQRESAGHMRARLHHAPQGEAGRRRDLFLTLNPAFRSIFGCLAAAVNAAACHVTRKTISEGPEHITGEERVGASAVVAARRPLHRPVTHNPPLHRPITHNPPLHRTVTPPPPCTAPSHTPPNTTRAIQRMHTAQHLQPVAPGVALVGAAVPEQPAWDKAKQALAAHAGGGTAGGCRPSPASSTAGKGREV
jgi:hypothetical protein